MLLRKLDLKGASRGALSSHRVGILIMSRKLQLKWTETASAARRTSMLSIEFQSFIWKSALIATRVSARNWSRSSFRAANRWLYRIFSRRQKATRRRNRRSLGRRHQSTLRWKRKDYRGMRIHIHTQDRTGGSLNTWVLSVNVLSGETQDIAGRIERISEALWKPDYFFGRGDRRSESDYVFRRGFLPFI